MLGPSGAGKTTLFRCLTGLTRPDRGTVDDRRAATSGAARRRAARARGASSALIFQQFNLIRRLTALENVLAGRLAHVPTWRVLAARASPAPIASSRCGCLDTVGLLDKADARADQLSGGQQQRVAIARALAQDATVDPGRRAGGEPRSGVRATVLESLRSRGRRPASPSSRACTRCTSPAPTPTASWPCATAASSRTRRPRGWTRRSIEQIYERSGGGAAHEPSTPAPARGRRRVGRGRARLRRARARAARCACRRCRPGSVLQLDRARPRRARRHPGLVPPDRPHAARSAASRVPASDERRAESWPTNSASASPTRRTTPTRPPSAFVVANAAVGSDKETLVFLSIEGVRLAQKGYADDIHEEGFAPAERADGRTSPRPAARSTSARRASRSASSTRPTWSPARDRRRRQARRVPVRRQPLRLLLSDAAMEPVDRHPLRRRRELRRRRPRLRQRPPAPDPPAHRPARPRPAARVPLDRDLGRGGPAGLVPADRQRARLVRRGAGSSGASSSARARSAERRQRGARRATALPPGDAPRRSPSRSPPRLPPPAPAPPIRPLSVMGIGSWPRPALDAPGAPRAPRGPAGRRRSSRRRPTTPCGSPSPPQLRAGVDVVTDGEQRRDSYASFVGGRLDNCQLIPLTDLLPLVDDPEKFARELRALDVPAAEVRHPAVFGPLGRSRPLAGHELAFVRDADRPAGQGRAARARTCSRGRCGWSASPTAPTARARTWPRTSSRVLREEVHVLLAAGAALVQLDEPVLTEVVFTGAKQHAQLHVRRARARRATPARELAFARGAHRPGRGRAAARAARRCTSAAATGRATSGPRWPATTGRCCRCWPRSPSARSSSSCARRAPASSTCSRDLPPSVRVGVGVVNQKRDAVEPRRGDRGPGAARRRRSSAPSACCSRPTAASPPSPTTPSPRRAWPRPSCARSWRRSSWCGAARRGTRARPARPVDRVDERLVAEAARCAARAPRPAARPPGWTARCPAGSG